ncbi:MAG TPA: T9SS type A sorting domain-containing protein [Paludibacter sp.]|nr:T9SS type A sorting domain-containing protein [Paludibacter sp.]
MNKAILLLSGVLCLGMANAQTKVFSYGFEPDEVKTQTTVDGGVETQQVQYFNYRDFDPADVVDTLKVDAALARTGTGFMNISNANVTKDPWLRAVKLRNFNFKQNTSYRFTCWVKGDSVFSLDGGATQTVSKIAMIPVMGVDYSDKAILAGDNSSEFGGQQSGYNPTKWIKKTTMFYFQNPDQMQAWWDVHRPSWSGPTLELKYFFLFNFFTPGNYMVDDLAMYESTIGGIEFGGNKLTVDFGYDIDVASLGVNATTSINFPISAFTVKVNGTSVTIQSVTIDATKKATILLANPLASTDEVTVDFTNPSGNNSIQYANAKHPDSANPDDTFAVKNFVGEVADYNQDTALLNALKTGGAFDVNVYANKGRLHVSAPSGENMRVELFSLTGSLMSKHEVAGNAIINTGTMPKGIYMVRLTNKNNETKTFKIQL